MSSNSAICENANARLACNLGIRADVNELLCCPTCLERNFTSVQIDDGEGLACQSCGAVYPINHGVPHLVDIRSLLGMDQDYLGNWHISQLRALPHYDAADTASVAALERKDVQQVISLINVKGKTILDIGSGTEPDYLRPMDAKVAIGLDPIEVSRPTDWPIVGGFAELLPFDDESFDAVLSITSLDHVFDLAASLRETYRVLKPGGRFFLWAEFTDDEALLGPNVRHTVLDRTAKPASLPVNEAVLRYKENEREFQRRLAEFAADRERYSRLLVDNFHFRHFNRDRLQEELFRAGFICSREEPIWTSNGAYSDFHVYERVDIRPTSVGPMRLFPSHSHPARAETLVTDAITRSIEILKARGKIPAAADLDENTVSNVAREILNERKVFATEVASGPTPEEAAERVTNSVSELQDRLANRLGKLGGEEIGSEFAQVRAATELLIERMRATSGGSPIAEQVEGSSYTLQQQIRQAREIAASNRVELQQTNQRLQATLNSIENLHATSLGAMLGRRLLRFRSTIMGRLLFGLIGIVTFPFRLVERSLSQSDSMRRRTYRFLSAYLRPANRKTIGSGRRILMLTVSQIDIDGRVNKVARDLAKNGYTVDIMCPNFDGNAPELIRDEIAPGIAYLRVRYNDAYTEEWTFYQEIFIQALTSLQIADYDFVHVNDLTAYFIGWYISRKFGLPLIYDSHEMWSENVEYDAKMKEYIEMPAAIRRRAARLERTFLKHTDAFFTVSPSIIAEYERRYKRRPKLLANFPDVKELLKDEYKDMPDIRTSAGISPDKFVTLYLGGLGPARNIEEVINAHQYLSKDHVFVIRGPNADHWGKDYKEQARKLGIDDQIYVLPGVGRDEVIAGGKGADCGIVMLRNLSKNFYWFYPNKFFEYSLGGLAVAVSNFPDVAAHVEKERCGVTFDPHDAKSIARALQTLSADREETRAMGERGKAAILREYNWETAVRGMLQAYSDIIGEDQKRHKTS